LEPESTATSRESVFDKGWGVLLIGQINENLLFFKCKIFDKASPLNKGYHACDFQFGTTTIPLLLSFTIFFKTLGINEKGGNA
jgi:hypothetical protein